MRASRHDPGQTLGAVLRNAEWFGNGAAATRPIVRLLPWKNKRQHRFRSQCREDELEMLTLKPKPQRRRCG